MRGDIDGDGKITENDRNRISEHLGGTITLTGADSWCAKVTGNNEISVSDLVQLVQYLEGKTNNLTGIPTFADYYNNWTYHKVDDLTGYWTAEVVINGLKTTSDAIVNISNDEGIFYKSELSDGAISFYATRPPIAEVPATITFKPGTGVITTSYESAKFHAATHSKDGADPIIPESIGALSLSGGTMTGSLILKDNPAKDLEAATKQYVDNHTSDTVLYTPQTLSDDQKTQARTNINAAPDGFGLGGVLVDAPENSEGFADANLITATGFYRAVRNVLYGGWHYIIHLNYDSATALQLAAYVSGEVYGAREKRLNVWGDWEHTNPPMELGIEYRTTERYLGKPVYVKLFDCGTIPAQGTHKDLVFSPDVNSIVSVTAYSSQRGTTLPYYDANGVRYAITGTGGNIVMIWNYSESLTDTNVHALIKYTKTTD